LVEFHHVIRLAAAAAAAAAAIYGDSELTGG